MQLWVDGNNLAHRAAHVGRHLTHGMAFIFLTSLRKVLRARPDVQSCVVCWDGGVPAFRFELFPEYKAKRRAASQTVEAKKSRLAFSGEQAWLMRTLRDIGVEQLVAHQWEADDAIAHGVMNGGPHLIYTGDKDMWQLVGPNVQIYTTQHDIISDASFRSYWPQLKHQWAPGRAWLLYRILTGDPSDGIPGVPGLGAKRGSAVVNIAVAAAKQRNCNMRGFRVLEDFYRYLRAVPPTWLEKHGRKATWATVQRNWKIMDLSYAALQYIDSGKALQQRIAPKLDLSRALERTERAGMASIGKQWLTPFTRL